MAQALTFPIMSYVPPAVRDQATSSLSLKGKKAAQTAAAAGFKFFRATAELLSPIESKLKLYAAKPLLDASDKLEQDVWIVENFPEVSAETMATVSELAQEWYRAQSEYRSNYQSYVSTYVLTDPVNDVKRYPENWNALIQPLLSDLAEKQRGIYGRITELRRELDSTNQT